MSPFFINAAACLVVIIVNKGLRTYSADGDISIAAYGISNRVAFIFVMIVLGLTQGMQPIVGYNYGAKQYKRVTETFKLTCICASAVMIIGFILNEFMPEIIARAFTTDAALIASSAKAMRIMSLVMPLIGFQMVTTNFFQSIGMVKSLYSSHSQDRCFSLYPCCLPCRSSMARMVCGTVCPYPILWQQYSR